MSQGVTYADLRFARSPPGKIHREEATEGELTYENIQVAQPGDKKAPSSSEPPEGQSSRTWRAALALVGTCLFLLATTVGFGIRYWQVSGQLQRASRAHAADSSLLERSIDAKQASLAQSRRSLHEAEAALNATREALSGSRMAENRTRARLERREGQLRQANHSLARLRQEKEGLEANVSRLQSRLRHAASCPQSGCCPHGWTLFRWKCLWISSYFNTWAGSRKDCRQRSSQLLILKDPWNAKDLWAVEGRMQRTFSYWIGLTSQDRPWTWRWVDNSHFEGERPTSGACGRITQTGLNGDSCAATFPYICEKAASPNF